MIAADVFVVTSQAGKFPASIVREVLIMGSSFLKGYLLFTSTAPMLANLAVLSGTVTPRPLGPDLVSDGPVDPQFS